LKIVLKKNQEIWTFCCLKIL